MNQLATLSTGSNSQALAIIGAADLADSTKRKYAAVVSDLLAEGSSLADRQAVAAFAAGLSHSRKAHLKAAVRLWSNAMIQEAKAAATPENIGAVDAAIHRLQALQTAVTVKATKGQKAHTWLSRAEVVQLMDAAAGDGATARRDRLALGLLVGAGLRREEAASLEWAAVKLQPVKGKIRTVLDVDGKGDKARVVPISDKLAAMLDTWRGMAGNGRWVLASVDKGGNIGEGLSAVAIFQIVQRYGAAIGKPDLAPHDLRRTYAQIGYESGVPVTQISKLLGHSSIATTQRYLNLDLNLDTTISDFVPM